MHDYNRRGAACTTAKGGAYVVIFVVMFLRRLERNGDGVFLRITIIIAGHENQSQQVSCEERCNYFSYQVHVAKVSKCSE